MNIEAIVNFLSTQGADFGLKLLGALAAWIVGRWLIGLVLRAVGAGLARGKKVDATLANYLISIMNVALNVVLVLAILDIFGVKTTSFAALLAGAGLAIGTASHMSPEQATGKELDSRSDLFSFGVVLYEMATGALPFQGLDATQILQAIVSESYRQPSKLNPNLPKELDRIIGKVLQKDRALRYQTLGALKADLVKLWQDFGGYASSHEVPPPRAESKTASCRSSCTTAIRRPLESRVGWCRPPARCGETAQHI